MRRGIAYAHAHFQRGVGSPFEVERWKGVLISGWRCSWFVVLFVGGLGFGNLRRVACSEHLSVNRNSGCGCRGLTSLKCAGDGFWSVAAAFGFHGGNVCLHGRKAVGTVKKSHTPHVTCVFRAS